MTMDVNNDDRLKRFMRFGQIAIRLNDIDVQCLSSYLESPEYQAYWKAKIALQKAHSLIKESFEDERASLEDELAAIKKELGLP